MGAMQTQSLEVDATSGVTSQLDLTPEESILVRRGRAALRRGHQEILELGKVLIELKSIASHGRFLRIVKEQFGLDRDHSAMFMRLATYEPFNNVVTLLHVPLSPHAMDNLRRLDPEQIITAINQGDIRPNLTVRETQMIVHQYAGETRITRDANAIPIEFSFRTEQVSYMQALAERWETSLSSVFRTLVDKRITASTTEGPWIPPKQITKNLTISAKHLQYIDGVASRTGLSRSDVARRLINEMLERDKSVDLPKAHEEFLKPQSDDDVWLGPRRG